MLDLPDALKPTANTRDLIFAAYERDADNGHRPHLGASLIGRECARALWYTFRWCKAKKFEGRMHRLFQTGHLEEPRIIADLRRIGIEVHEVDPTTGKQFNLKAHGGHFGGSMDGVGVNVPEAPKTWHVMEFKTSSEKKFKEMVKSGVQKAKPEHYAQMTIYMGLNDMTRALYVMKNKNNDDLHVERVRFDKAEFERLMAKAGGIVRASEPPGRISLDASAFACKFCDFIDICHQTKLPEVNCRTCAHSTPEMDGDARWSCARADADMAIPLEVQRTGCTGHRYIPILLQNVARPCDFQDDVVIYELPNNTGFIQNGEGGNNLSSAEIRAIFEREGQSE